MVPSLEQGLTSVAEHHLGISHVINRNRKNIYKTTLKALYFLMFSSLSGCGSGLPIYLIKNLFKACSEADGNNSVVLPTVPAESLTDKNRDFFFLFFFFFLPTSATDAFSGILKLAFLFLELLM